MILIGVCGGIAAYKTCELVRLLVRGGYDVQVVQTPDSQRFVGPTTFAALSRRPVVVDGGPEVFPHLDASSRAEILCIAPLSATTLSRIANGEAANVLTATTLAFAGPVVAAPAMNPRMWEAEATVANLQLLAARGVEVVGPARGDTAEGEVGRASRACGCSSPPAARASRLTPSAMSATARAAGWASRSPTRPPAEGPT
jgi:phosphopantothenoylcysteine decarboxylase/phosphopantothenate--cysteine ligase